MLNFKQPQRLEKLALYHLGEWVACIAERLIDHIASLDHIGTDRILATHIKHVRAYLSYNVPWMLNNHLAAEVIRSLTNLLNKYKKSLGFRGSMGKYVSQMNVAICMAEVVFTDNLTVLCIDSIPQMMHTKVYAKIHMLSGLVHLNLGSLTGGWKTADMQEVVVNALKPLHRLRSLIINYDCTDKILNCLVENCLKLERLDTSSSKCVTNESIDIIIKLKHLKSIQLYRTFVTLEGYAKLLIKCKTLEDIGRCDEIGKVLEYIDLTNSSAQPLSLITYVSRYAPVSNIQLAVQMCPKIRNMTVYHNTLQGDLMALIGLPEMTELKLLSCDFYADQVKQVLQVKGCNLSTLHLEHVDQIDLNALMYISQMCPMLKSLTLYNCTLIQHTSLYTRKLEILPFRNLKRFTLVSNCNDNQLSFVLSNCVNVEYIHIGTAVQLTDEFIEKLLDKNPLIYLKELRIMQSEFLTMATVERLIYSCKNLRTLVELECWSKLSKAHIQYIKNYIETNNINISVEPISRYEINE